MRVLVVGAGGLGSYVGGILARAGHDVALLARGAHARVVRDSGLEVSASGSTWRVHPRCVSPGEAPGPTDVVILAVKAYSLDEVVPMVRELADQGATVLSLLNGVNVGERLAAAGVSPHRVVDGVAYLTAFRTAPGRIERKGEHQRLIIGSVGGASQDTLEGVERLFSGTGVEVEVARDIREDLWSKMAVVCSLAVLCGLTGSAIGLVRAHPFGRSLQERAIAEVLAVGRGAGVPIPGEVESQVGAILDGFPADFYPSVLHDLRSGRPTEMDHLGGALARFGREFGVETPLCDAATCAVALTERRGEHG